MQEVLMTIILIICVLVGLLGLALLAKWLVKRLRRNRFKDLDQMEGHDFEYFCASLLEKRGYKDVEVTSGSRDYGIDILARKDGISSAIQCKCYSAPAGVKAVPFPKRM